MEYTAGNVQIRPNFVEFAGVPTQRHRHNFPHPTYASTGWFLVRGVLPNGNEIINQFGSPEYRRVRALLLKYEPESVLRPIRFPDVVQTINGKPYNQFDIRFIKQGEPVPEGGKEIEFDPQGNWRLIAADVEHEFVLLSSDGGNFDCIYAHRTPQGDVVQHWNGWAPAYGGKNV